MQQPANDAAPLNGHKVLVEDIEDFWPEIANLSISIVVRAKKAGMRFRPDWLKEFRQEWLSLTDQERATIGLMDQVNFGDWLEEKILSFSLGQPYKVMNDDE